MLQFNDTFIKPRYNEGGFAGIPTRVENAFASGNYDAVVIFLIDGFGWRFFERFQDVPCIQRIAKRGKIEKLTSQFPSTTAAHVPGVHGVTVEVSQNGGVWREVQSHLSAATMTLTRENPTP